MKEVKCIWYVYMVARKCSATKLRVDTGLFQDTFYSLLLKEAKERIAPLVHPDRCVKATAIINKTCCMFSLIAEGKYLKKRSD